MEKSEIRAVIKFFVLDILSPSEIHTKLVKVLKGSAPSFPNVQSLSEVVRVSMMTHVLDDQKRQLIKKWLMLFMIVLLHTDDRHWYK